VDKKKRTLGDAGAAGLTLTHMPLPSASDLRIRRDALLPVMQQGPCWTTWRDATRGRLFPGRICLPEIELLCPDG